MASVLNLNPNPTLNLNPTLTPISDSEIKIRIKIKSGERMKSLLLHIVTEQLILIADVELPSGDDRVRPTVFFASVRLIEPAFFFIALRGRFNQGDRAFAAFTA